jgi:phosphatidylglycerol:prolipoprotein diacylglycerol transferase
VPIGVITFNFDPLLYFGDTTQVRIQTVVLGLILATSLLWAILDARLVSRRLLAREGPGIVLLRIDDFGFIVIGVVPGAVVGGRLGYVLLHLDYYAKHVGAIADPSQGNLEMGLAVLGGAISGAYVARLLEAPIGRWADALIVPALFALGAGKLALILGGEGQGLPSSVSWATSYGGDGPWGSLAPTIPSHPSQAYEGVVTLVLMMIVGALQLGGLFRRRTGTAFLVGIALWAIGRAIVASTWRDAAVLGPLRVDQLIGFGVVAGCLVILAIDIKPAVAEDEEGPAPEPWEAWDLDLERRLLGGQTAPQLPASVSANATNVAGAAVPLIASGGLDVAGDSAPETELVAEAEQEVAAESGPVLLPEGEPEPASVAGAEPVAAPEGEPEPEWVDSAEPVVPSEGEAEPQVAAPATDEPAPEPAPESTAESAQQPPPEPTPESAKEPGPSIWLASEEDARAGSTAPGDGPVAISSGDLDDSGDDHDREDEPQSGSRASR